MPRCAMNAGSTSLDVERHVGAAVAVEQQRKRGAAADAQEHERGQPLRVEPHMADVDAFSLQRVAHEAAVLFIADARQHRRPQAEAGAADRGIGGRAAESSARTSSRLPGARRFARHTDRPPRGRCR